MSDRTTYDVSPRGERWAVKRRGAERATAIFDNKEEAIERAKHVAKRVVDSQVVVGKADGTIQTEYTYGHDPFPPKG
jgi:uncharacterized protein YdaT